jgi:hypothetical protein
LSSLPSCLLPGNRAKRLSSGPRFLLALRPGYQRDYCFFLAALTITQFSSDLALAWFKARRGLVVVEQAACRYVARLFSPLVLPAPAELTGRPASPPSTLLLIRGHYCLAALFRTSGVSRLFALTTVLQIRFA